MFIVNGLKAILRQFNRKEDNNPYDDQNYKDVSIKLCPYNTDISIMFNTSTTKKAVGYFIVNRLVDVRIGDQIIFTRPKCSNNINKMEQFTFTVQEVKDSWIYNRIENKVVKVK